MNDLEFIEEDFEEKLSLLKERGCVYIDSKTKELTLESQENLMLNKKDYDSIVNFYIRYTNNYKSGWKCKPCAVRRQGYIIQQFDELLARIKNEGE